MSSPTGTATMNSWPLHACDREADTQATAERGCASRKTRSSTGDVDDRVSEGLRGFLRKVVADTAFDEPVLVFAGEILGVSAGVRVRRPVGITFKGDCRHVDERGCGQSLLQAVEFRLALSEAEAPAVIVDHDGDMIRIVERLSRAIERGIIEIPSRRSELPN